MATNILALKKEAVKLGMDKNDAKKANRSVLEDFIKSAGKASKPSKKSAPAKKAAVSKPAKKATVKKKAATKPTAKKSAAKPSAKKAPAAKKSAPAGKAKRPSKSENGVGRHSIGSIDWTVESEDWNPRAGGPVERLFKALKKAKGNVDKAYEALSGDMYDFVGKTKRNGERRSKGEAQAMLRYRLSRTKFEYARRTGQHESATDRVEYGTGDYASTRRKGAKSAAKKAAPAKKSSSKKKSGKKSKK